ncbi:unnamed protein product (macronuclear) [Paramecium tetraurelia]|uniref:Uncharacterized protein n=1 Tax=Paramecium tetraurelia TaxID=5888 RepID=A0DS58_PARTE|nr:uncharacterized protein GSPATT00019579001 [Paramecium tetraurelia]CAK85875.1 unnamed protein product [Paramecium tetraurelia]|eukprot:XP_001453272.1 hypothetical protein (macronuclear) [Paramecium tetraurelia strain d4-2]
MQQTPLRGRKNLFDCLLQKRSFSSMSKSKRPSGIYIEGIRAPLDSRIQKARQHKLQIKTEYTDYFVFETNEKTHIPQTKINSQRQPAIYNLQFTINKRQNKLQMIDRKPCKSFYTLQIYSKSQDKSEVRQFK